MQQVPGKVYLAYTCPLTGKIEMVNYRQCFHAIDGWLICSADFSGQELAVMAAVSGDEMMMSVLNSGGDLHSEAAAGMFGIDPKDARQPKPGDPRQRSYRDYGKILMFSLAYGKTAEGFAKDWGCSKEEAEEYIAGFEKRFPQLAKFLKRMGDIAQQSNYSRILNGAIRFVGGGDTGGNRTDKGAANRAGKNNQIQGLSSWMTRIAMITLDELIMTGRIENQWALKSAEYIRDSGKVKLEAANIINDSKFKEEAERDIALAERILSGDYWCTEEALANADDVKGVIPIEMIACIHDELLTHFEASSECQWTRQRRGENQAWNEAKAAVKAAGKAKDKEAEKAAKTRLKSIEATIAADCSLICEDHDHYVPGHACVTVMEKIIGISMRLAGTYYLKCQVPAGYEAATSLVWVH